MPRRRYCMLIGLIFCWLVAGLYGGTGAAALGTGVDDSGRGTVQSVPGVPDDGSAVLGARSDAQQLEQTAEALYGYVVDGNVAKVRQLTEEVSRIFVSSSFEGLTSVEGINALSAVIIDLKSAIAGVKISPERWESAAARLRLAANSLNHPRQPMWLHYYKLLREDLNAMEQSASASDLTAWKTSLERLQSRYDNIRPAVLISRQPEVVNAFDSWLSYAAGVPSQSQKPERARLMEIISYGQDAVRVMFGKEKDEPALSLPLAPEEYGAWGLLAAGFILAALVYVGYRKYRGQSEDWRPV
ncbi:sporulation protein YpjB [Paenibacillus sp. GCM10012306]|uniref:sporulation protein YpjB n=1 Tax=Paenibacillus sp. GCM10012306 TaxID=3317342 RepID=UPI00360899C0